MGSCYYLSSTDVFHLVHATFVELGKKGAAKKGVR
jgi:hypothetical protein